METIEELTALKLAALTGELSAVVQWCVSHEGECLSDNPKQLIIARRVLAKCQTLYDAVP